jgi:hypothetical protein
MRLGTDRCMGEINPNYHKALDMMELSARAMEKLKKLEQETKAEEAFKQTLEKLWLLKSNEKPN